MPGSDVIDGSPQQVNGGAAEERPDRIWKLVFVVKRRRPDHPQPQSTHGGESDSHVMEGEGEANLFRSSTLVQV